MRSIVQSFFVILALWGTVPAQAQDFRLERATHEQLRQAVSDREAPVQVVNFWATWCMPCREEFPELIRFGKDFADDGVDVVFVSMDDPNREPAVLRFLQKQGIKGLTYIKDEESKSFVKAFSGKWKGALPSTLVYGPNGEQQAFWRGTVTYEKLQTRVSDILATTDSP